MWHEARKQERKIRGMLVDYRRRAERRRDFYEKIKADPTQFLQLHGRPTKIHLDSSVAAAADSPATMMPWQGQADNLIDRFDVRAHLDFIPPVKNSEEDETAAYEERQCNYERYRILAQNIFLGIHEEKFLKQLHMEEQFGYTDGEKDKKRKTGVAIGFNYEDPSNVTKELTKEKESSDDEDSDSDLDVDLCIDVSKVEQSQAHELNKCGQQYGMRSNDFYSFLTNDLEEAENIRLAREEEHEKALFSGRKSRRERRAHREKRLANRVLSPPSYAARQSPTYAAFRESKSRSKSPSPVNAGQITYITSFGDDEEPAPSTSKPTYADKVKYGKRKATVDEKPINHSRYEKSRRKGSEDRDDRKYRRRSRSRSRSRSRMNYRYKHRRSRSHSRRRKSRSRSRSRNRHHSSYARSRSRSRSRRMPHRNYVRDKRSRSRSHSSNTTSSSSHHSTSRSKSRSRSRSISHVYSRTRSKSTSSRSSIETLKKDEPPKPIQRYYGRRVDDKSSSDLEASSEEDSSKLTVSNNPAPAEKVSMSGNSSSVIKSSSSSSSTSKMTPQERLKRKMQLLLNKQYKADKIAEQIRTERAQQEQRNREDELREMALKLRRKQRERRHAYDDNSTKSSESDSSSSEENRGDREKVTERPKKSVSPASPRRRPSREEERPKREEERGRNRDEERSKIREEERAVIREEERSRMREEERARMREEERTRMREEERTRMREEERTRMREEDRFRSRDEERVKIRDREREKSPHRSKMEQYKNYRDNSPTRIRNSYDDKRNKNKSLVDY